MKKLYVVFLALVFLALGTVVYAAPPGSGAAASPDGGPQGRAWHHHSIRGKLDLSKEQQDRMHEVWNRYRTDVHDLRYDLMEKRIEVKKLFTDPKTDQATLLSRENELNGLREKLMERRTQAKLEWRSILTPEQIQKLDRMPGRHAMSNGREMM